MTISLLAAVGAGLAAGRAGALDRDARRELLGIPPEATPVGVIPIGDSDQDGPSPSRQRGRKPLAPAVHRRRWRSA